MENSINYFEYLPSPSEPPEVTTKYTYNPTNRLLIDRLLEMLLSKKFWRNLMRKRIMRTQRSTPCVNEH